jgi:hypothetical protein
VAHGSAPQSRPGRPDRGRRGKRPTRCPPFATSLRASGTGTMGGSTLLSTHRTRPGPTLQRPERRRLEASGTEPRVPAGSQRYGAEAHKKMTKRTKAKPEQEKGAGRMPALRGQGRRPDPLCLRARGRGFGSAHHRPLHRQEKRTAGAGIWGPIIVDGGWSAGSSELHSHDWLCYTNRDRLRAGFSLLMEGGAHVPGNLPELAFRKQ